MIKLGIRDLDTLRAKLDQVLKAMLGSDELVQRWWTVPNRAFNDQTPLDVFDSKPNAVVSYILGHASGDYH
jgi:Protein of unknown function (DUF2384)